MKQYKCPECKEISDSDQWEETEVPCELCGSHSAIICPKCREIVDMGRRTEKTLYPGYKPPEIMGFVGITYTVNGIKKRV